MTAKRFIRAPSRTTLMAALVTAIVAAFTMFVQGGAAARAADEQPSASVSPKIVGGTEVPDGKYPFMTLLVIRTTQAESFCDGTLIDPDSVLTAAHCFLLPGKPQSLQVYVGRTVRSSNQGQARISKTVAVHPDFNPRLGTYDAAVVKLTRPVSGIAPIDLATSEQNGREKPGRDATVAGWGNTIAELDQVPGEPEFPDRMHEVQVPIVSDSRADKAWEDYRIRVRGAPDYVPLLMVAASEKAKGACHGDSGGPLFSALESDGTRDNGGSGGKYTQIGIVSHGGSTCGGNKDSLMCTLR